MFRDSENLLVYLLNVLNDYGEKDFLKWYKDIRKDMKNNYGKTWALTKEELEK